MVAMNLTLRIFKRGRDPSPEGFGPQDEPPLHLRFPGFDFQHSD
jgi:hypothetical protein